MENNFYDEMEIFADDIERTEIDEEAIEAMQLMYDQHAEYYHMMGWKQ